MFNWEWFLNFWAVVGFIALAGTWLIITIMCATGWFKKSFRIAWLIGSFVLIVISTIIIGFTVK